jgi:hypothetical protein
MPFSDISKNDKITFSDTKSYPDCLPVGNAEKVYLFRYPNYTEERDELQQTVVAVSNRGR